MLTLGFRSHRHMLARGGCGPIFDCRETAMGPRNSHLETLRRTQTVEDCAKRTVSEAYPCMTSTCHTHACTHPNGCACNSSNESRPMRRPCRRRFGTRHDGSTQAPSDSDRGPGETRIHQMYIKRIRATRACIRATRACKHSVARALDVNTFGFLPSNWYTSRPCMIAQTRPCLMFG